MVNPLYILPFYFLAAIIGVLFPEHFQDAVIIMLFIVGLMAMDYWYELYKEIKRKNDKEK